MYVIQEWLSIQSESFNLFAVWVYVLCVQLIQTYYEKVARQIQDKKCFNMKDIARSVRRFQHLQQATELIQKRFGLALMSNCCFILVTMINASYYSIVYGKEGNILIFVWDLIHAVEAFLRLLLLCQFSDRIRCSVQFSIQMSSKVWKLNLLIYLVSGQRIKFDHTKRTEQIH